MIDFPEKTSAVKPANAPSIARRQLMTCASKTNQLQIDKRAPMQLALLEAATNGALLHLVQLMRATSGCI